MQGFCWKGKQESRRKRLINAWRGRHRWSPEVPLSPKHICQILILASLIVRGWPKAHDYVGSKDLENLEKPLWLQWKGGREATFYRFLQFSVLPLSSRIWIIQGWKIRIILGQFLNRSVGTPVNQIKNVCLWRKNITFSNCVKNR